MRAARVPLPCRLLARLPLDRPCKLLARLPRMFPLRLLQRLAVLARAAAWLRWRVRVHHALHVRCLALEAPLLLCPCPVCLNSVDTSHSVDTRLGSAYLVSREALGPAGQKTNLRLIFVRECPPTPPPGSPPAPGPERPPVGAGYQAWSRDCMAHCALGAFSGDSF